MTEPVLHHYPVSPFAEKVRAMLGFKGLAWKSVQIPLVMPKPDVVALETGGIALGQQAAVMPVDSGFDQVTGELVNASADEIVIRRSDPRAGTVQVHFPRFGYQLNKPS